MDKNQTLLEKNDKLREEEEKKRKKEEELKTCNDEKDRQKCVIEFMVKTIPDFKNQIRQRMFGCNNDQLKSDYLDGMEVTWQYVS